MLFNSLTFALFFILFYTLFLLVKNKRLRVILITLASYVFYGFWNSPFVVLLILSTVVDFRIGRCLEKEKNKKRRKYFLAVSLMVNLGMLFFFKYFNLFIDSSYSLMNIIGFDWEPPLINVVLPVGISFYTFQTLSYTIDIYNRKLSPEKDFWTFAAFVSFFPQLVAGPILRAKLFLPQFGKNRTFSWEIFYQGFFLIVLGLFKKMVLADNLAPYVERVYDNHFVTTFSDAWISTLAFTFQIYMDFSGYSDIAIGLALLLGFYIPDNFNSPYAAVSFSDFWRRWHISLSSWLRDYLYIPLGGNKKSKTRTNVNLAITMLLGGLWHGAAWNFVIWGGMHGAYLFIERSFGFNVVKINSPVRIFARRLIVFLMVVFAWVMFRADISRAKTILLSMFGFVEPNAIQLLNNDNVISILGISIIILGFHFYFAKRRVIDVFSKFRNRELVYTLCVSTLIFFIIIFKGTGGAFIYFQF